MFLIFPKRIKIISINISNKLVFLVETGTLCFSVVLGIICAYLGEGEVINRLNCFRTEADYCTP
jgi:hypothetical protein